MNFDLIRTQSLVSAFNVLEIYAIFGRVPEY